MCVSACDVTCENACERARLRARTIRESSSSAAELETAHRGAGEGFVPASFSTAVCVSGGPRAWASVTAWHALACAARPKRERGSSSLSLSSAVVLEAASGRGLPRDMSDAALLTTCAATHSALDKGLHRARSPHFSVLAENPFLIHPAFSSVIRPPCRGRLRGQTHF